MRAYRAQFHHQAKGVAVCGEAWTLVLEVATLSLEEQSMQGCMRCLAADCKFVSRACVICEAGTFVGVYKG